MVLSLDSSLSRDLCVSISLGMCVCVCDEKKGGMEEEKERMVLVYFNWLHSIDKNVSISRRPYFQRTSRRFIADY
jgi:hypothetical protein